MPHQWPQPNIDPMWRIEFEGHAVHCDDRDLPSRQSVQRGEQILCRSAPPGELRRQGRHRSAASVEIHYLIACGKIGGCNWRGFPEYPRQLVAASPGEGRQFQDLALAGLVRGGNPVVDGRPLSQLVGWGTGARTMVTFPAPPLKFRTSGFPGSGFKHQAPQKEIGTAPSATFATLKADPAIPVAISRVYTVLRLDSTILQSGWYSRSAPGSGSRHDLPSSPPGPRGPRSGRVMLSRPSPLNRPHPPVRRTPRHFPHCGYRRGP